LPGFRKNKNIPQAKFSLRYGTFVSIISIILCAWLIFNSTFQEFKNVGIVIIVGYVLYYSFKLSGKIK